MFCKNCFKKISSKSHYCKYCGAPVKQKNQRKEIEEQDTPPVQGPPVAPQENDSSFKLRSEREKEFPINPRYISVAIIVVLLIAVLIVLGKSSIFQTADSIDYQDYVGIWQERDTDDVENTGGVRLQITAVSGDAMNISMAFYDGKAEYSGIIVKNVGATLKDGSAYYTFSNDGYGNSGNGVLTFKGRDITWKSTLNGGKATYYEIIKVKDGSIEKQQEVQSTTVATSTAKTSNDYILPDSDTKYLTKADLKKLTSEELRIARNEIMARHGRIFNDPELASYFDSKDWYNGAIDPETFDSEKQGDLNKYELKNIQLIQSME